MRDKQSVMFKIARLLKRRPISGYCCFEVEKLLGLPHQTASARLHDLERVGLAKRDGTRRKTPLGGSATPYVPTPRLRDVPSRDNAVAKAVLTARVLRVAQPCATTPLCTA